MGWNEASSDTRGGGEPGKRQTQQLHQARPCEKLRRWWAQRRAPVPRNGSWAALIPAVCMCAVSSQRQKPSVQEGSTVASAGTCFGRLSPSPTLPCATSQILLCPRLPHGTPPSPSLSHSCLLRSKSFVSLTTLTQRGGGKRGRSCPLPSQKVSKGRRGRVPGDSLSTCDPKHPSAGSPREVMDPWPGDMKPQHSLAHEIQINILTEDHWGSSVGSAS